MTGQADWLCQAPLVTQADLFTSEQRTPWGGNRILERYKRHLGLAASDVVGESWELSGHSSAPSHVESPLTAGRFSIQQIARMAPESLFGKTQQQMPFLVKLINSGSWAQHRRQLLQLVPKQLIAEDAHQLHTELSRLSKLNPAIAAIHREMVAKNLSIQVHPKQGDLPGVASKSEAWLILEAEAGAGIYLGLHPGVTRTQFESTLRAGDDCSHQLQFLPVQAGDVFSVPAGTLHAIGAGVLLLELQESADTTFRAYDWGRPRQLHLEEALHCTSWDGPAGEALRCQPHHQPLRPHGPKQTLWVQTPHFNLTQMQFTGPNQQLEVHPDQTGLQGYFIESGAITITSGNSPTLTLPHGRSFFLPAASGPCQLASPRANLYAITS